MISTIRTKPFLLLTILFLIENWICYAIWGIKIMDDSIRYQEWGIALMTGTFDWSGWGLWYVGYVMVVAFFIWMGLGTIGTILFQVLMSYLALWSVYRITQRHARAAFTPLVAGLLYLGFIEITQWNFYLLTESLFCSLIIILLNVLEGDYPKKFLISIPLLLFILFFRPMGITVLMAALGYFFYSYRASGFLKHYRYHLMISATIGVIGFAFLLASGMMDLSFYYEHGQLVSGAYRFEAWANHPWLNLDDSGVQYPARHLSPLTKMGFFTWNNPLFLLEMIGKKVLLFIFHVKPYYSNWHNGFILLFLLPLYFFAFKGSWFSIQTVHLFAMTLFLANGLMVGLTVESWDGRFLIPTLPPLLVVASLGLEPILMKTIKMILGKDGEAIQLK